VEPCLVQPIERIVTLGPTINQIANTEQAIYQVVESGCIQSVLQSSEMAMNVTDREISAGHVCGEALDTRHL
jgi:hypothetical protein